MPIQVNGTLVIKRKYPKCMFRQDNKNLKHVTVHRAVHRAVHMRVQVLNAP